MGLYWAPGPAGVRGNEIAYKIAKGGSVQKFIGPEPSLGVSIHIKDNIIRWVDNQHLVMWRGPGSTERQAREIDFGSSSG
jgi:hypothetical protein